MCEIFDRNRSRPKQNRTGQNNGALSMWGYLDRPPVSIDPERRRPIDLKGGGQQAAGVPVRLRVREPTSERIRSHCWGRKLTRVGSDLVLGTDDGKHRATA